MRSRCSSKAQSCTRTRGYDMVVRQISQWNNVVASANSEIWWSSGLVYFSLTGISDRSSMSLVWRHSLVNPGSCGSIIVLKFADVTVLSDCALRIDLMPSISYILRTGGTISGRCWWAKSSMTEMNIWCRFLIKATRSRFNRSVLCISRNRMRVGSILDQTRGVHKRRLWQQNPTRAYYDRSESWVAWSTDGKIKC